MPTNNKSIQILRGNKSSLSNDLKGTILKSGQPFFDKNAKTLQIGNGTDNLDNAPYVTVKDGAIVESKLDTGSVTNAKIRDRAINDAKIADDAAIKGSKLADASNDESNPTGITTAKIENKNITTDKIEDGAITTAKLDTNAVTESNIDNGAVTETKLGTGAVTTTKIKDRSITGDKLVEDFVFEQLGQYTFTLSDGQFSKPTLEFADLHPSSNARVFLLADLEGKKDYQARLILPTIANTEENTLATKEQIESGEIVAKTAQNATNAANATNAQKTDISNAEWILHDTNADKVSVNYGESYEIITYGGKFFDDYSVLDIAPTIITIPPASMWNKTRGCGFILSTTTGALMGESNIIRFEEHMILIDRDLKMAYGCYVKKWNFSTDTWESEWTTQNGKFSYRRIR